MGNKMEITVKIKGAGGNEQINPVTVEVDVPDHTEFPTFREGFDKLEQAVLKARQDASEQATEAYMEALSKKNRRASSRKSGGRNNRE